jgi:hypothetical protein
MTSRKTSTRSNKTEGYEKTRFNALRHGVLSRYTVLPWEDTDEYQAVLDALVDEHAPDGLTQEHLVEEIAGIFWRKRRLRMAECAAFRRALTKIGAPDHQTVAAALIHVDVEKQAVIDTDEIASVREQRTVLERAIEILRSGKSPEYDKVLSSLDPGIQARWAELTKSRRVELIPFDTVGPHYAADADGLLEFLENEANELEGRRTELESPELIRDQSLGEGLKPEDLDGLIRYEIHLDRKLERVVGMLIRLKELRGASIEQRSGESPQ